MYPDTPTTENAERRAVKLTKRHLVRLFWVLTVPFLFPSVLAAEPSLAETVQYIEAKITAVEIWGGTWGGKSFRLNGRTVTYITRASSQGRYTFKLDALSTGVAVKECGVENCTIGISCARGACISQHKGDEKERAGGIDFLVSRVDAERVQKALTHAIRISGGKDELF